MFPAVAAHCCTMIKQSKTDQEVKNALLKKTSPIRNFCTPKKSPGLDRGFFTTKDVSILVVAAAVHLHRPTNARIRIAAVLWIKVWRVGALAAPIRRRVIGGRRIGRSRRVSIVAARPIGVAGARGIG